MAATTVVMPQLGESVVEGTVVRWIAKPGQQVKMDDPLVEVSTDKANTEVPSPAAGVLIEQLAAEGAVVAVGAPLARMDDSASAGATAAGKADGGAKADASAKAGAGAKADAGTKDGGDKKDANAQSAEAAKADGGAAKSDGNGVKASPVARNVAQEHGVDLADAQGSGPGGRIVKADVISVVEKGASQAHATASQADVQAAHGTPAPRKDGGDDSGPGRAAQGQAAQNQSQSPQPPPPLPQLQPGLGPSGGQRSGPISLNLRSYKVPRYNPQAGDQVIPFDQRRRLIAEHMVYSKATSPHVPCTAEVDMTKLAKLRETWKKAKETGGKAPSFLVGICRATIQALGEFPKMNSVVQDETIIQRKDVNLGIAVETEKGLLVPVIRKADEKSVLGLGRALDELAGKARAGKVTADDLSGRSFTVSNPGLKGNLFGAAIINQPQVGILRMGEIVKRAVVREMDGEDVIVIRQMMYLTLSYDHRIIDGVTGNGFLHRVRELIEAAEFTL